jgi:hypothetical protein
MAHIVNHAPEMIRECQKEGITSDALCKELGMPRLPEGEHKDRTLFCISQSGPCIITTDATIERIREFEAKRAPLTQVEVDRIAGKKRMDAEFNKQEKARIAQEKKEAETNRFKSLSKEDQKAEKDEKKRIAAEKKATKEEANRIELEIAERNANAEV